MNNNDLSDISKSIKPLSGRRGASQKIKEVESPAPLLEENAVPTVTPFRNSPTKSPMKTLIKPAPVEIKYPEQDEDDEEVKEPKRSFIRKGQLKSQGVTKEISALVDEDREYQRCLNIVKNKPVAPPIYAEQDGKKFKLLPLERGEKKMVQNWSAPYAIVGTSYVMDLTPASTVKIYKYATKLGYANTDIYALNFKQDGTFKPIYVQLEEPTFEPTKEDRKKVQEFAQELWKHKIYPIFKARNFGSYEGELRMTGIENLLESGLNREDFRTDKKAKSAEYKQELDQYLERRADESKSSLKKALDKVSYKRTVDLENNTLANDKYRRVIYTGETMQLVLMSLKAGETIDRETHIGEQFIRVEDGEIKVIFSEHSGSNTTESIVKSGQSIIIPYRQEHRILADKDTKLYTVYSFPRRNPIHERGTNQPTKEDSDKEERKKKRETTEQSEDEEAEDQTEEEMEDEDEENNDE